ncbi:TetR/AcrR family transcriptional regulator [Kaistia dalseonensis]|uniref:AcrR family transcriptional regulator n=1 Tax=Kaistia dalseonensis TaxID=410840 RepID=A0ABU0H783_9HYPH|nr:TetR/AcrR family transcriptional regulator [Kaistia dalseonensis]MCX5495174.1 TetR/AcrR family transcriptional regulator [Kaistia dalseonensis]MDQ0437758.1 AcrR family transcriptional regulator [Kaistia dalseonensis]
MMANEETKARIVDAFLALLGRKPFGEVGLTEIADEAGISLGELRGAFDGKISILADFTRRIDRAVLDGVEPASDEDTSRDRLFDIVMRRLDLLAPYKDALGHLEASARRDPGLALCLNRIALDSARFMLAAAGVSTGGLQGAARAQGFVVIMARIIPIWRADTDPDQSRTMAALDRALERATDWSRRADRAGHALCALARRIDRHRPSRARQAEPQAGPAEASEQPAA